jgi:hypothetical protein
VTATPHVEPTTRVFPLATLAEVLAEIEAAHPEYGQRPIRAASIIVGRRIEAGESGQAWYVQSETDREADYLVGCAPEFDLWTCSCKDHQQRGGTVGVCKHILAVQMLAECEQRERGPQPSPILFPTPTLDPDAPIPFVLTDKAHAALDDPAPMPA